MLTREEVLDELALLSTIEHALCVEYLFVACVLGHGRPSADDDDDVDEKIDDAAGHALNGLAVGAMQHLRAVNETLVRAGRRPSLGRATTVAGDPGAISFAPLTAAQLDGLLAREYATAAAVDARYARLPTSLEPLVDPATGEDPLANIGTLVGRGSGHAAEFAALQKMLAGLTEAQYLRVRRDQPADDLERGLRDDADDHYERILASLQAAFAELSGVGEAVVVMFALGELHIQLANRGLLPAFTLPRDYAT
jgi:hypothetical protein